MGYAEEFVNKVIYCVNRISVVEIWLCNASIFFAGCLLVRVFKAYQFNVITLVISEVLLPGARFFSGKQPCSQRSFY